MSNLKQERTNFGELTPLIAEIFGEALAEGLNAFEEIYRGGHVDSNAEFRGAVINGLVELLKTQVMRPDGVKTVAKTIPLACAAEGDYVQAD